MTIGLHDTSLGLFSRGQMTRFFALASRMRMFPSRCGWRIPLAVLLSVLVVEAVLLLPVAREYKAMRLESLELTARSAADAAYRKAEGEGAQNVASMGRLLVAGPILRGVALYQADGGLVGSFGEAPQSMTARIRSDTRLARELDGLTRYEVLWPAATTSLPYHLIVRVDSSEVREEFSAYLVRWAAYALLVSAFAAVVASALLVRLNPSATRRLEDGDGIPSVEFQDRFRDHERGKLIQAYNAMLERLLERTRNLRLREQHLSGVNKSLERQIARRSTQLADIYNRLETEFAQRMQTETALRDSEQRLADIAANLPGDVFRRILHPDGRLSISYVSESSREFVWPGTRRRDRRSHEIYRLHPSRGQAGLAPGDKSVRRQPQALRP